MAPIASYLATSILLIHVSLCAPMPQIAHEAQVLQAISNLKNQITDDPKGVTKTWTDLPPPTNGKHKESSSSQDDYPTQKDDYYPQQNDQEDYWKKQQKEQDDYWKKQQQQQNDQQDDWWKDWYKSNGNDNNGYPQPEYWKYPGWKGKFHSSGDHSTENWNGWPKGGCPDDPSGWNC